MKSYREQSVGDFWKLKKLWDDNPDALGFICLKKRGKVEDFAFRCYLMYKELILGKTVGIMSMTEDLNYLERVQNYLMTMKCEVEVKRVTRKEPANNIIYTYNRYDEVIGIDYVEQVEVFSGWSLKMKK